MSRYIDADDAIAKYAHYGIAHMWDATDLEYILDEMPSIDIVRCKECKYGEHREDFDDYECHYSGCGLVYDANDFCSYGERSE